MKKTPKQIGEEIRRLRLEAGLTQHDLGYGICTDAYVSLFEAGLRLPSLDVLTRIAYRLAVPVDELIGGKAECGCGSPLETVDAEICYACDLEERAKRWREQMANRRVPVGNA